MEDVILFVNSVGRQGRRSGDHRSAAVTSRVNPISDDPIQPATLEPRIDSRDILDISTAKGEQAGPW